MAKYQEPSQLSGRVISEFGMEAYPHLDTTRRVISPPSQQQPGSAMMDFRNKAGDHERRPFQRKSPEHRQGSRAWRHLRLDKPEEAESRWRCDTNRVDVDGRRGRLGD